MCVCVCVCVCVWRAYTKSQRGLQVWLMGYQYKCGVELCGRGPPARSSGRGADGIQYGKLQSSASSSQDHTPGDTPRGHPNTQTTGTEKVTEYCSPLTRLLSADCA